MVSRDAFDDVGMFFEQPQVALLMGEKHEFLGAGLRVREKQFGQQPAEFAPVWIRFIKAIEIFVGDKYNFRILHGLYEIPAGITGNEASERNHELIFGKEEEVFVPVRLRIAVVDPENAFDHQAEVVANHALHIKKIALFDPSGFPEGLTLGNILICQCVELP